MVAGEEKFGYFFLSERTEDEERSFIFWNTVVFIINNLSVHFIILFFNSCAFVICNQKNVILLSPSK